MGNRDQLIRMAHTTGSTRTEDGMHGSENLVEVSSTITALKALI